MACTFMTQAIELIPPNIYLAIIITMKMISSYIQGLMITLVIINCLSNFMFYSQVEVDRRMLDFCVGLDTEFSEIVEGSHLYYPKTKFDQVGS